MSWQDRIENTVFTIRTGDGKAFFPSWKNGETSKEYNAATFEFIDVPGALIDRKRVRARKFPLVFWFQGEDNIDQADDFDTSADDPRGWTIQHPFYGDIFGQPISISRNDMQYNCTEITVDFWESIQSGEVIFPGIAALDTPDIIAQKTVAYGEISAIDYSTKVNLKAADLTKITNLSQKINAIITKGPNAVNYSQYIAVVNTMEVAVSNVITAPAEGINTIHNIIIQPAQFELALIQSIDLIGAIYLSIKTIANGAISPNDKALFEALGGSTTAALASAIVNSIKATINSISLNAIVTRDQVTNASINLVNMYNDYLAQLDSDYVPIGDPANSYTASQQTQNSLQDIVLQALGGLEMLAFNAKVERLVTLNYDSNIIILTHKYMGLDPNDANIELFRTINNLKNNFLFIVEKGTQIKYYA